jgi:hypothetical protein
LQSKKTQVARPAQRFLSGGLRTVQVFPGCHDVGMIENYRDSNDYILALFRKSDRLSNGGLGLVYLSLFEKGSGQHRLCEDLLVGVSIRTKRRDRGTTEFFGASVPLPESQSKSARARRVSAASLLFPSSSSRKRESR